MRARAAKQYCNERSLTDYDAALGGLLYLSPDYPNRTGSVCWDDHPLLAPAAKAKHNKVGPFSFMSRRPRSSRPRPPSSRSGSASTKALYSYDYEHSALPSVTVTRDWIARSLFASDMERRRRKDLEEARALEKRNPIHTACHPCHHRHLRSPPHSPCTSRREAAALCMRLCEGRPRPARIAA